MQYISVEVHVVSLILPSSKFALYTAVSQYKKKHELRSLSNYIKNIHVYITDNLNID